PPLFEEGLATPLQGTWWGIPVGREARRLANELNLSLKDLVNGSRFVAAANRDACCMLAACFTELVIHHSGRDVYGQVFDRPRRRHPPRTASSSCSRSARSPSTAGSWFGARRAGNSPSSSG